MKRTVPFVLAGVLAMAGCGGDEDPSAMPTPQDSLSTSAPPADDTGPSSAPPDEVPTTSAPPDDAEETTEPPEADITEDSEAGAEAFARHYIDLINETGMEPEEGVLEPLAAPGCKSCENYAGNVSHLIENGLHNSGPAADVTDAQVETLGAETVVFLTLDQLAIDVIDEQGNVTDSYEEVKDVTFKLDLGRSDGSWTILEIFVNAS